MHQHLSRLLAGLAICLAATAAPATAEYRSVAIQSLRVTVDSDWPASSVAAGYLPIRIEIANLGGEERTLDLVARGQQSYRVPTRFTTSRLVLSRQVRVPPAGRVRFTMDVPTAGDTFVILQLQENGETIQAFAPVNTQSFVPGALIVASPGSAYHKLAQAWPRAAPGASAPGRGVAGSVVTALPFGAAAVVTGSGPVSSSPLDLILPPERLPASWLGYTSLRIVVIGAAEWELLDAEQRGALLAWTAAGGTLLFADGGMEALFPDPAQRPFTDRDGGAAYLFGHIHLRSSAEIDAAGFDATMQSEANAATDPGWALPLDLSAAAPPSASGVRLRIPGVEEIPSRAYLAILTFFSILIGPVNYLALKRMRQPALVLLTTPLLSAVFIALLGSYVVVVEGFGIRGRAITFTQLDQTAALAATHSTVSIYTAGRTPARGLQFPRDMAVVAALPESGASERQVDLTDSQRFASGLLAARTPSTFKTIAVRRARERLTVRRDGAGLTVTNGLGATVTRLLYHTRGRSYTLAEPLALGATAALEETTLSGRDLLLAGDTAAGDNAHLAFDVVVRRSHPNGSYLAVLDRSPFLDTGVGDIEERGSFHFVLGTGAGEP